MRPTVDVTDVGKKLGARYLLQGTVRRAGNRIRVASQLIDTANNTHIWAGRFDQVVEDMFDLQDEIVGSIVGAVVPQFVASFQPTMPTGSRTTLSSWEWAMRGWNLAWRLEESGDSILRASAQIAQVPISGRREWKS